ncbi:MAG: membrane protein insertion efficiency factor YidD [Kofleriaceae bacterium]|nr:membrane protein insertion efficiency factor YidD [Kofleriaceae bacterium]
MSLARRVVVAAIAGYRRWLSGRGPLARVRCTFHHGQSCSAFGLRAVDEAPGTWAALGRIRRRLRRCGATSIHALTDPAGRRALGWGPDHDRPLGELCAELTADGEQPADVAAVLAARVVVARWRGDATEVVALARLRRGPPRAQVLVRQPPSPRRTAVARGSRRARRAGDRGRGAGARADDRRRRGGAAPPPRPDCDRPRPDRSPRPPGGPGAGGAPARRARRERRRRARRDQRRRAQVTRGCLPRSRTVAAAANAPVASQRARTASP